MLWLEYVDRGYRLRETARLESRTVGDVEQIGRRKIVFEATLIGGAGVSSTQDHSKVIAQANCGLSKYSARLRDRLIVDQIVLQDVTLVNVYRTIGRFVEVVATDHPSEPLL